MKKLGKLTPQKIELKGIFQNKVNSKKQHFNNDKFMLVRTDLLDKLNRKQFYEYK
jgi:hypothetical protein